MSNTHLLNTDNEQTLFHITHYKAGSQWLYKILSECAPEKIVLPLTMDQFPAEKILPGKIYPTLYLSQREFTKAKLPNKWQRLIIIRDLRDTLISLYFSLKVSHPLYDPFHFALRNKLNKINNLENEIIYLMNMSLHRIANFQYSWLLTNEPLIRYEDLLSHDVEILTPIISNYASIPEKRIEEIIITNRFESMTNGRKRGQVDIKSHERKAKSGDWANYFNERIKLVFKKKFGDLLIKTGYEKNNDW